MKMDTENETVQTKPDEELTLEEAFVQIEAVIRHMEQPEISLSDSLSEYERGVALLKLCDDQIDRVEKQMVILRTGPDGPDREE